MGEIVLITGPAGFVGFKTVLTALRNGYNVRAVIRKAEQAEKLKSHSKIAPYLENLEFVVVPDLTKEGAFDDVLSDVVAILHIASPLAVETDDYDRDVINPAIKMSTSILHSAKKAGTIRRVIICSSMVTLAPLESLDPERIYTSKDINSSPTRPANHSMVAYITSKVLARTAVHDFLNEEKPTFEIIQLLPGVIIGADERAKSVADLHDNVPQFSLRMSPLLGETQSDPMPSVPVDVGDVAKAHVDAISLSIPGDVDYILASDGPEGAVWDDMIDIAKKGWPERCGTANMPLGGSLPTMKWKADGQETEKAYGWTFKSFEDTMKEMIEQYLNFVDAEEQNPTGH